MAAKKVPKRTIDADPKGILVPDPTDFLGKTKRAISRELGLQFADIQKISKGSRETCYLRSGAEAVTIDGKPYSAVRLLTADTSLWLVVEMEWEPGKPALMQHISLKVHEGKTGETAKLCFRAEWDLRDRTSEHAQPHWNVHPPTDISSFEPEPDFETFAEQATEDTFEGFAGALDNGSTIGISAKTPSSVLKQSGFTAMRMHQFHFAMSAPWAMSDGGHSPKVETSDQLVTWMSKCARYIRGQMEYVRRD